MRCLLNLIVPDVNIERALSAVDYFQEGVG
jgi:hypothetical protein